MKTTTHHLPGKRSRPQWFVRSMQFALRRAAAAASAAAAVKSPLRPSTRKRSVMILFIIIVSVLLVTYAQTTYLHETYEQIKFQIRFSFIVVKTIFNIMAVNRRKRKGLNVSNNNGAAAKSTSSSSSSSSSSIEENSSTRRRIRPSSWPDPPLNLFQNSTRLIWAYWHSGEENLPTLCQVSLQSWRAHHNLHNWQIIILSDDNFHHYVPTNHIPSTFDRLKVQFRSDIVRLSVLARYGGAYLDMTTLMFQSLEGIWENELRRVEKEQQEGSSSSSSRGGSGRNRIFVPTVLELGERLIEEEEDDDDHREDSSLRIDINSEENDAQQQQQQPHTAASTTTSSSKSNAVGLVTNSVILSPQPNIPSYLNSSNGSFNTRKIPLLPRKNSRPVQNLVVSYPT